MWNHWKTAAMLVYKWDTSFYGNLGEWRDILLLVCVELGKNATGVQVKTTCYLPLGRESITHILTMTYCTGYAPKWWLKQVCIWNYGLHDENTLFWYRKWDDIPPCVWTQKLYLYTIPFSDVPECKCLEAYSRIDSPQVVPAPLWSRNGGVFHAQVLDI